MLTKMILVSFASLLVGCAGSPVHTSFPTPPEILMQPPESLTVLKPTPQVKPVK